ncbi:MAG: hypothetical protein U0414_06210 [Polyangiaceae bacterium]
MRLGRHHLPLLVAPLFLTACPSPGYTGPVEVPRVDAVVPVGAYVSLSPFLRGRFAPMPAQKVSAKCVDASICDVAVVGQEVRVGGKKAGRAEVVVGYEEADGRPNESRVVVNFGEGLVDRMAPGKQGYDPEHLLTIEGVELGGHKANFACTSSGPATTELGEKLELGSATRGTGALYSCLAARPLSARDTYYRFASLGEGYQESSTPDEIVHVCAARRPESTDVVSLTVYRFVDGVAVPLERRGETGEICGLKQDSPSPQPKTKVISIEESKEGGPIGKQVTFELTAPAEKGCDVRGYELRWPGGAASLDLESLHVDAGKTDQRSLKVDLTQGDLVSLDLEDAQVFPRATCR